MRNTPDRARLERLRPTFETIANQYAIEVAWHAPDKLFIAAVAEFPHLCSSDAKCPGEAVRKMREALLDALEVLSRDPDKLPPQVQKPSLVAVRVEKAEVRTFLAKLEKLILDDIRKESPEFDWESELDEMRVCDASSAEAHDLDLFGSSEETVVIARVQADGDDAEGDPEYGIEVQLGISAPGWGLQSDDNWTGEIPLMEVPFTSVRQIRKNLSKEVLKLLDAA